MLNGEVEVWVNLPDGSRKLVDVLEGGNFFGEMGLMTGEARSGTVIARSMWNACGWTRSPSSPF